MVKMGVFWKRGSFYNVCPFKFEQDKKRTYLYAFILRNLINSHFCVSLLGMVYLLTNYMQVKAVHFNCSPDFSGMILGSLGCVMG